MTEQSLPPNNRQLISYESGRNLRRTDDDVNEAGVWERSRLHRMVIRSHWWYNGLYDVTSNFIWFHINPYIVGDQPIQMAWGFENFQLDNIYDFAGLFHRYSYL